MYKNVKEKMHFILHLMIHLTVQSRGAPEGTLEGAPNDALSNLHKDVQEGAFEVALNYEHVIAVEGTLDDSFKSTPTFEV